MSMSWGWRFAVMVNSLAAGAKILETGEVSGAIPFLVLLAGTFGLYFLIHRRNQHG